MFLKKDKILKKQVLKKWQDLKKDKILEQTKFFKKQVLKKAICQQFVIDCQSC